MHFTMQKMKWREGTLRQYSVLTCREPTQSISCSAQRARSKTGPHTSPRPPPSHRRGGPHSNDHDIHVALNLRNFS